LIQQEVPLSHFRFPHWFNLFVTMDAYFNAMDALGNKIVAFVDPQNEFTGYTEVRERMNPAFSHIIIGPRPNNEA
jgi:hypothetical protein